RGLVFQLSEGLGALKRDSVTAQLATLGPAERKALAALGVRLGLVTVWLARLDDKRQRRLLRLLAALWHRLALDPDGKPDPARLDPAALEAWQMASGQRVIGGRAFGFGELERLALGLRQAAQEKTLSADPANATAFGLTPELLGQVMRALGL